MFKRVLLPSMTLAVLSALVAGPAAAAPTAVWNVPTGTVTDAGNLHVGVYTYSTLDRSASMQDGLTFGALPGLELGGVSGIGALELGVDTFGTSEVFNGKLQLFGETLYTPAFGVGAMNAGNTTGASENIVYGAITKEIGPEDMSGGSWTIGYFTTMPSETETAAESGVMGGMTFKLTDALNVGFDFMMGHTSLSGGDLFASYSVADSAVLTAGYYLHPSDSTQNLVFIGADLDVPTGLFGKAGQGD